LKSYSPILINDANGHPAAIWHEVSIDELIEQLEFAYQNKGVCAQRGHVAANDMQHLAWDKAAREFHAIGVRLAAVEMSGQSS